MEWDLERQKLRTRARRRMALWAIASGCMIVLAFYGYALAHRKADARYEDISEDILAGSGKHAVEARDDCPRWFAGDSEKIAGSCWCGAMDGYCMCTPSLAIDTVIEIASGADDKVDAILVIRRKDNDKLACVGGFVEVGETLEHAVRREVMEETGLTVSSLRMIPQIYDDPDRDARRHTVSVAYIVRATGEPVAGAEEKEVVRIPVGRIREHLGDFAFDHSQILSHYLMIDIRDSTPDGHARSEGSASLAPRPILKV